MPVKGQFAPLCERFEDKFIPEPMSGCWLWLGGLYGPGVRGHRLPYGKFWINNRTIPAHIAAWRIYRNEIPVGFCVLHKCDVPWCVNPDHLFLGTPKDNTVDMICKGRHEPMLTTRRGERNNFTKLTASQVQDIRSASGLQREIAAQFGITQTAVSLIKRGKNWKHLEK